MACGAPTVTSDQTVTPFEMKGETAVMQGDFPSIPGLGYTLTFENNPSSNNLNFTLNITDTRTPTLDSTPTNHPEFVMASLKIAADENEAFWGFGEQFTYLNQRGKVLRLINMEQGIFRGIQPESTAININTPGTAGDIDGPFSHFRAVAWTLTPFAATNLSRSRPSTLNPLSNAGWSPHPSLVFFRGLVDVLRGPSSIYLEFV